MQDDDEDQKDEPTRWNDYDVKFVIPNPTELPPPLMQMIDVSELSGPTYRRKSSTKPALYRRLGPNSGLKFRVEIQSEETWFLPLVGHRLCVLRNTLCLRLEFGVKVLGLPLIVRCTAVSVLGANCATGR
eukprot:1195056-Prorocentrum_minimum.AAC.4